jgi:two-component system, NtrC family, nitrogen regulation sensor histidine kinase GlnL
VPTFCGSVPHGAATGAGTPKSSLDLWRDIIDSIPEALIVISRAIEPVAVNPAAETMLGVSPVTATLIRTILRNNDWLGRMVTICLESGQSLGDPEGELHVGPRAVSVRTEVSPLLTEDGRPEGAIVLLHDLAHQKSAEHAAEPGEASLRLSPAGLAHEVKNPLTGIKGAAELLAAMFPTEPRAQQYCAVILDGVNRIAALVEQVLAVSSPQRLAREPVNIHQILHGALRLAGLYPEPPEGIEVEQDFDPSLPEVTGDAAALERAFLNLIRNAAEAIGESGTVRLHTRMETEFRMTAEGRRRQFLRVEVADSGPGMPPNEMAQLFTPFFTTKPTGTGLGLVLSQRIFALHGGRLWAERGGVARAGKRGAPVAGMTFRVTLPVRSARTS